jgi:hypothetical protein
MDPGGATVLKTLNSVGFSGFHFETKATIPAAVSTKRAAFVIVSGS